MMDNGNFMKHASKGLREYCHLKATAYVQNPPTYVNIPDDDVQRWNGEDLPDADVYLLNDHTYFHHYNQFKDLPRLVKCNGTFARGMGGWFQWDYTKHDTLYLSGPCDISLARALPFSIQTIGPIYDHRYFPQPVKSETQILVVHAPTSPHKGTDYILKKLHKYRKKGTIEIDMITKTPYLEAIQRKSSAHIFIDQYTKLDTNAERAARGAFGISSIEALDLGCITLTNPLHPYVHHHLDPIPIYEFPKELETFIHDDPKSLTTAITLTNSNQQSWARKHFDISQKVYELRDWLTYVAEVKQ